MESRRRDEWLARGNECVGREDLAGAIAAFSAANRVQPSRKLERQLLQLRRRGFLAGTSRTVPPAPLDVTGSAVPIDPQVGLAVATAPVTAAMVRSTIATHGSLVVRNLIDPAQAAALRETVATALAARPQGKIRWPFGLFSAWYHEFEPINPPHTRKFTEMDGMLAVDSPRGLFQLLEVLHDQHIDQLAAEVVGGAPVLAAEKSVFRRIVPGKFGTWHQDGAFLGEHNQALDVWIALTPCGRTAPALEILPCRVDRVLTTGDVFSWDLPDEVMRREYPGVEPVSPEFEPGDAILFDQLCVHRTGHRAGMTESRMAIECWLFSAQTLPAEYTGLLL